MSFDNSKMTQNLTDPARDSFKRPLHDLRISVIDRCNLRCNYCMPTEEEGKSYNFLQRKDWLTFGEIVRLVKLLAQLGVRKVRVTGGEPLLRPDLAGLIRALTKIEELEDLALTTNGILLTRHAAALKDAGLDRVTVSLDTLDDKTFRQMSGNRASVEEVLAGIETAKQNGFTDIKLNAVIQKGVNDSGILDLVEYSREQGHTLRFIEYMDVGNCNHWDLTNVVPSKNILDLIASRYPLAAVDPNYYGEVAERYRFLDGGGEIGFISSVSQPFCGTCTRLRLSTDGKFYTCLFAAEGEDVKTALRHGATDEEILIFLKQLWEKRADKYSENRYLFRDLKIKTQKVEMFQVGG